MVEKEGGRGQLPRRQRQGEEFWTLQAPSSLRWGSHLTDSTPTSESASRWSAWPHGYLG